MKIISIILTVFLAISSFAGLNTVTQNSMTTNGAPNNTVKVPALDASGNMTIFGNAVITNSAGNTANLDIIGNAGTGGVDIKLQSTPSGLNVTGGSAGLLTATLFGGSGASLVGYAAAFGVGSAAVATNLAPNTVLTTNQVSQDGGALTNLNRNANGITNYVFAPTNSATPSIIGGTVYTPAGTNAALLLGVIPVASIPSSVITSGGSNYIQTFGATTNIETTSLAGVTNVVYGTAGTNVYMTVATNGTVTIGALVISSAGITYAGQPLVTNNYAGTMMFSGPVQFQGSITLGAGKYIGWNDDANGNAMGNNISSAWALESSDQRFVGYITATNGASGKPQTFFPFMTVRTNLSVAFWGSVSIASNQPPTTIATTNGGAAFWNNGTNLMVRTSVPGNTNSSADYTLAHVEVGSTNAIALTAFTATFAAAFTDTNYTAIATGNGIALASAFVSNKTTNSCLFNMTAATGNIDWVAVHK